MHILHILLIKEYRIIHKNCVCVVEFYKIKRWSLGRKRLATIEFKGLVVKPWRMPT